MQKYRKRPASAASWRDKKLQFSDRLQQIFHREDFLLMGLNMPKLGVFRY